MDIFNLSTQDRIYIIDRIREGTDVVQAFAQLKVLKDEAEFKDNLMRALGDPDVRKKFREMIEQLDNLGLRN